MTPKPIYLDHNATTPVDPEVFEAMEPFFKISFGNPSSVEHSYGNVANVAVENARRQVADFIGAKASEVVFTGSCTEANNIAILGTARANPAKRHIITSVIEHPAVIEPVRQLERIGYRVDWLGVTDTGLVDIEELKSLISDDTLLVSVMAANNEVGVLQPIRAIGSLCDERGTLFHSDLAQIPAYHPVDVVSDHIHLASLSAHKAYGPKGIGALYLRSRRPRVKVEPLIYGGGQERGIRPGTLNTASIVGMGKALEICHRTSAKEGERLSKLCLEFWKIFSERVPEAKLNGPKQGRLANNLSISVEGIEPLALMRRLRDIVSFSASSACATDKMETSHVLKAMFGDTRRARQTFRIAPGRFSEENDVMEAAEAIAIEIRGLLANLAT